MFEISGNKMQAFKIAVILSLSVSAQIASGQTIQEMLAKQRAGQPSGESSQNTPAAAAVVAPPPAAPAPKVEPPPWRVHSIYSVGKVTVAEVTLGEELLRVQPGSTVGRYKVVSISPAGLQVESITPCKRRCPPNKTVGVGGLF